MHCSTDAINQVSLQCFIKSEQWSQGKSTAFVQILQSFTMRLSSWGCKGAAQQSLTSASFHMIWWFLGQVWGDHIEQRLQSLHHEGILLSYPPWLSPVWHKPVLCSRKPRILLKGRCRFTTRGTQTRLARSPCVCCFFGSKQEKGFLPSVLSCQHSRLTSFWLWLSTLQDLFVGGF